MSTILSAVDIATLPKAELHCHQDGIVSPDIVRKVRQNDPTYPLSPDDFASYYPVVDMESFFKWWKIIAPISGKLTYFYPIIAQHIAHLKAQNVRYCELMLASGELERDPVAAVEGLRAFSAWVNAAAGDALDIAFVIAFGRDKSPERLAEIADRCMALYEAGLIVGVALAGPEPGYPVKPFRDIFARYHEAGLGIEIHAGEWCGPESVWDALDNGFPDRIGHGVSLFQDPKLVEIFQERQIHIEMCPTSNVKTGSVACIEAHPIVRARDLGMNFSINTDDPGPFENSMNSEYALLAEVFGFGEDDFMRIYENTLGAWFGG